MPGLPETMYCSEQISIPPAFPYLLRQYAKAAIRSQPTDLLQWSTAYFRCLSLNIPPPVKPRLEYPIPRDHFGISPGWLKALLYQLSNNQTINFKILWDRWTGACLSHNTLIELLCLGGFDNPKAIPWLRFIGLCAAHLTDDLTSTMKLICEIITEEPEGGSAMIAYETFMDLYIFLAKIDASKPQVIQNVHFTDSILSLYKETEEEQIEADRSKEDGFKEEEEIESKSESFKSESIDLEKDMSKEEISCPSLGVDDHYSVDYYIEEVIGAEAMAEESQESIPAYLKDAIDLQEAEEEEKVEEATEVPDEIEAEDTDQQPGEEEEPKGEIEGEAPVEETTAVTQTEETPSPAAEYESVDTIVGEPTRKIVPYEVEDEKRLREDLERLKALQQEIPGELDEEVEKFKCRLIAEMPLSQSQQMAIEEFKDKAEKETEGEEEEGGGGGEEKYEEQLEEPTIQEVHIDQVPGIGPIIPDELIDAVQNYMKSVSMIQHGMVMPRNIRHYNCPPLEIIET